ncbi:MAG: tetratricopeptide repeat protein [Betaproteobacteria bacterium]
MTAPTSTAATLLQRATEHASRGEFAQALPLYDAALAQAPGDAIAHLNRGVVLHRLGRLADAGAAIAEACRLVPGRADAWSAAGHVAFARAAFDDSANAFLRAAVLDAANAGYPFNAGMAWERLQAWSRAADAYRSAYERAPSNTAIWEALDRVLGFLGRPDDAAALFAEHVRRAPMSARLAAAGLLYARMGADPALEARCLEQALAWDYQPENRPALVHALSLMQYHDVPRERLHALYVRANEFAQAKRDGDRFHVKRRLSRGEPIRVGYLSADFRIHPMGRLMADILRCHDPKTVTSYLFSLAPPGNEDALTAEFRRAGHAFDLLAPLTDRAAAEQIASRELDLLVDLMSLSAHARPGILLHKPAPVIVTHLGYHGPVALEQVDCKITDAYADPPDNAAFQIERLLPLSTCVLPFRRVAPAADAPTRAALGLPADAVVCAEFVGPNKLSPRCLALWAEFMRRVPTAWLAFSVAPPFKAESMLARLAAFGIPRERVVFIPLDRDEHRMRARYAVADLALDTVPYTGGEATVAALDMGVPVVTVAGQRHSERMTASILHHLGVPELIADDDIAFVELAVRLATDAAAREAARRRIQDALDRRVLGDMTHYTRCLEAAYRTALTGHGMLDAADVLQAPSAPR